MLKVIITDEERYKNRPLLPLEVKEQWVNALKSGEYEQGNNHLCYSNKYCCLGVLCEITNEPKEVNFNVVIYNNSTNLYSSLNKYFKILSYSGSFNGFKVSYADASSRIIYCNNLTQINDGTSATFSEIADLINEIL